MIKKVINPLTIFLVVSILFFVIFFFDIFLVQGDSMENLLFEGDIILVSKANKSIFPNYYKKKAKILKNDILIFKHVIDDCVIIKRCIGVCGDIIQIADGIIYCNDSIVPNFQFQKSPYRIWYNDIIKYSNLIKTLNLNAYSVWHEDKNFVNEQILTGNQLSTLRKKNFIDSVKKTDSYINQEYILYSTDYVQSGLFMIGDNLSNSYDSRHFGPIPEENIIGKATFVLFNYHNGKFRWDRFLKKIE